MAGSWPELEVADAVRIDSFIVTCKGCLLEAISDMTDLGGSDAEDCSVTSWEMVSN